MANDSHEQLRRLVKTIERAHRSERLGYATAKEIADNWLAVEIELAASNSVLGTGDAKARTAALLATV